MPWSKHAAVELGARIRRHRRRVGLTQEELAHVAGITKNQVQLIEAGRGTSREDGPPSNPRATTLFGLAEALGVAPAELLLGLEGLDPSDGRSPIDPAAAPPRDAAA